MSALVYSNPCSSPLVQCSNYTGYSNGSLPITKPVTGYSFDRFIQIWFENTDFAAAASSPQFAEFAQQGMLLTQSYAVTHPSEPNYIASVAGDFFGLNGDDFLAIPANISTIADVLDEGGITWASYQENMPTDGYTGYNYTSYDYLTGSGNYTYYVRKHSPLTIFDSISQNASRALRNRNFNDLAVDVNAGALPQWVYITPNLVNDAHNTDVNFAGHFLEYFLGTMLNNSNFNDNRTLILVTFDENESYSDNNQVYSFLTGGALPARLRGTNDSTYYTHYSSLSTVQANWGLGSLGRGDTNSTLNNVYKFVAETVNHTNNAITAETAPLTNITDTVPGPLNTEYWFTFLAPNINATGAGEKGVVYNSSLDLAMNIMNPPAPINLTALYNVSGFPAEADADLHINYNGSQTLSGISSLPKPTNF